jgi:hypothetical protein
LGGLTGFAVFFAFAEVPFARVPEAEEPATARLPAGTGGTFEVLEAALVEGAEERVVLAMERQR